VTGARPAGTRPSPAPYRFAWQPLREEHALARAALRRLFAAKAVGISIYARASERAALLAVLRAEEKAALAAVSREQAAKREMIRRSRRAAGELTLNAPMRPSGQRRANPCRPQFNR
jgi:hypothetical protein